MSAQACVRARLWIAILVAGLSLGGCRSGATRIARDFSVHRAEYERLLVMVNEDPRLVRIAPTFTWLENDINWPRADVGLSEVRWEEYRRRFAEAGIEDGVARRGRDVYFLVSSSGLGVSGVTLGVAWLESAPQTTGLGSKCRSSECFERLDGRWYAFEWR